MYQCFWLAINGNPTEKRGIAMVFMVLNVILMEMGIQFLENWKGLIPNPVQMISILGPGVYYSLRLLNPLLFGIQKIVRIEYPKLENHFFVLKPI